MSRPSKLPLLALTPGARREPSSDGDAESPPSEGPAPRVLLKPDATVFSNLPPELVKMVFQIHTESPPQEPYELCVAVRQYCALTKETNRECNSEGFVSLCQHAVHQLVPFPETVRPDGKVEFTPTLPSFWQESWYALLLAVCLDLSNLWERLPYVYRLYHLWKKAVATRHWSARERYLRLLQGFNDAQRLDVVERLASGPRAGVTNFLLRRWADTAREWMDVAERAFFPGTTSLNPDLLPKALKEYVQRVVESFEEFVLALHNTIETHRLPLPPRESGELLWPTGTIDRSPYWSFTAAGYDMASVFYPEEDGVGVLQSSGLVQGLYRTILYELLRSNVQQSPAHEAVLQQRFAALAAFRTQQGDNYQSMVAQGERAVDWMREVLDAGANPDEAFEYGVWGFEDDMSTVPWANGESSTVHYTMQLLDPPVVFLPDEPVLWHYKFQKAWPDSANAAWEQGPHPLPLSDEWLAKFKLLLEYGANPDYACGRTQVLNAFTPEHLVRTTETLLNRACHWKDVRVVEALLVQESGPKQDSFWQRRPGTHRKANPAILRADGRSNLELLLQQRSPAFGTAQNGPTATVAQLCAAAKLLIAEDKVKKQMDTQNPDGEFAIHWIGRPLPFGGPVSVFVEYDVFEAVVETTYAKSIAASSGRNALDLLPPEAPPAFGELLRSHGVRLSTEFEIESLRTDNVMEF